MGRDQARDLECGAGNRNLCKIVLPVTRDYTRSCEYVRTTTEMNLLFPQRPPWLRFRTATEHRHRCQVH